MIHETTFLGCDNLPPEMQGHFDKPWNFVGDVHGNQPWLMCHCEKCNRPPVSMVDQALPIECRRTVVEMRGYLFITDDMLEVTVYFGTCGNCGDIYWARQGPPFKRARCHVPLEETRQ